MSDANPTVEPKRDWVSQRAVAWVIDEAPVPVELAWTLTVIARRCDENGCGSYQSMATISEKTGKSEDQARRDVKQLLKLKLIRLGDQSLPEKHGVPAGQRPVVYDVALELKGPKPERASKNKSGKKKTTPGMDATPRMHARGGMDAPGTPGMHAEGTPGMHATQTKPLNNPLNNPSPLPPADTIAPSDTGPDREGRKIEIDPETQRINTLVAAMAARRPDDPRWKPTKVEQAIRDCLTAGRTLDQIEHAFPICEADPDTASPGRLKLPFPWWEPKPDRDQQPPPAPQPAAQRLCPHPDHHAQPALNCTDCRSEHEQGRDPFADHPNLRPPGWIAAYGYLPRKAPIDAIDLAYESYRTGYLSDPTRERKRSVLALRPIGKDAARLLEQGMSEQQLIDLAAEAGRANVGLLEYAEQHAGYRSTQPSSRDQQPRSSERTQAGPARMQAIIDTAYAGHDR